MNWNNRNDRGYRQPRQNFSNNGYRQQQGGNVQGGYKPNSGNAKPNERRQKQTDPAYNGVMNIETPDGQQHTFFVKIWENDNGSLGLKFQNVLDAQEGNGNRGYQGRSNGGYSPEREGGRHTGSQNYQNPPQRPQEPSRAMSRARPIQPPIYQENGPYENAPPPGGPEDYNVQYDDENPQY